MSVHIDHRPDPGSYAKYNRRWIEAVARLVEEAEPAAQGARILDVGCGRGELLGMLATRGYRCHGVDFDPVCVELSRKHAEATCCAIEALGETFAPASFDVAVLCHVLEHTASPTDVIEAVKRIVRRWIIVAVPNLASTEAFWQALKPSGPSYVNEGHREGWDAAHLLTFLECTCGLKVRRWEPDRVLVPTRVGGWIARAGLADLVEVRLLPRLFPRVSNSLVVLCEKAA